MLVLYIFILMFTISINHLNKKIHSIYINRISILTILVSILLSINVLNFQAIGKGISIYSGLFQITVQSQIVEILLLIIGLSILMSWHNITNSARGNKENELNLKAETPTSLGLAPTGSMSNAGSISNAGSMSNAEEDVKLTWDAREQYSLVAIFSIVGGSLLMSSLDLLSMYLSIELQSFAVYILATLNKDSLTSTSAGLKYFLLGSLSSCFILLGSAIIYSYTGLTQFEAINALMSVPTFIQDTSLMEAIQEPNAATTIAVSLPGIHNLAESGINKAFTIGLVVIIIGFLFKVSAAPFYQ